MWHNELVLPDRKGFINTLADRPQPRPPLLITVKMSGLSHQTICINTRDNYVTICLAHYRTIGRPPSPGPTTVTL